MNEIVVSVVVITYNHCQYIEKALDSILSQKTDFKIEILIGDDASSDGTAEIILNYQKKYPDIIIPFIREKNIGATKNDYDLKCRAKGKYIAQLEGDDYWSDNNKLQKQVDFLERHSEYIACSHQCYVVDDMGKSSAFSGFDWVNFEKSEYKREDFCAWKTPGHTSAMVYRNIFNKYDCSILWKADSLVGDRTMALLLITHGRIYCMREFMSCYRYIVKSGGKNWASVTTENIKDIFKDYRYIYSLEKYADNMCKCGLDVHKRKQELLMKAFKSFKISQNRKYERQYIINMLRMSRHKLVKLLCKYVIIHRKTTDIQSIHGKMCLESIEILHLYCSVQEYAVMNICRKQMKDISQSI